MIYLDQKPQIGVVLLLLFTAVASRFYGIWEWDLVNDEYFTATKAYERYASIINPAYYSLVVLTYKLFGDAEWLSRIPAFILAVVSIPVLYFSWSRNIGRNAALFASGILIFSAWHLWFSQYARFYIGVLLFSSLAYFFFFRAIYVEKLSHLIWAMVFSVLAVSFHVTAIFVPVSVAVAYLVIFLFMKKEECVNFKNIKIYLVLCLIAGVLITPVLYMVLDRWVATSQTWGYGAILIIPQLVKYIQVPIVITALFGWLVVLRKDHVAATFFFAALVVPALFLIAASPFMAISPSYAFYILPVVVLLAGIACEEVRKHMASTHSFIVSAVTFFLLIATLLPSFASHFLDRTSFHFNSVVYFVDDNFQEGDRVLSFKPGFAFPDGRVIDTVPFISFERDNTVDWRKELQPLLDVEGRTWIIASSKRKPLASGLERWLFCNAKLVWQKHAVRLDYEVNGYQIYIVSDKTKNNQETSTCIQGG
ncbi:MAG: hypothetical protein COA54_00610 [Thiotrichaceae bacterium]|nr:MAG: hypothetical protein COA54_00610 [Thiotrichaceae bacterium]